MSIRQNVIRQRQRTSSALTASCRVEVATLFVWRAEKLPQKTWLALKFDQKRMAGKNVLQVK